MSTQQTEYTILAVDDSASMRGLVSYVLDNANYSVVSAVDGVDALQKAQQQSFDLVLTDINMPRMDGIELIKALRDTPQYRLIPLLALTTESGSVKKMTGKAAGATGWIEKPFEPDVLVETIQRLLGPSGQ